METLHLLLMFVRGIGTGDNADLDGLDIVAARRDLGCMTRAKCLVPGKRNAGQALQ